MSIKLSPEDVLAFDAREAAVHEVSHAIVASKWTGDLSVAIFTTPGHRGEIENKTVVGQMRYRVFTSRVGRSAVGWAGVIGEWLDDDANSDLFDIIDQFECDANAVSDTDRKAIEVAAPKQRIRAAQLAFDRLCGHWSLVCRIVDALVSEYAKHRRTACIAYRDGVWWNGEKQI